MKVNSISVFALSVNRVVGRTTRKSITEMALVTNGTLITFGGKQLIAKTRKSVTEMALVMNGTLITFGGKQLIAKIKK